MTDVTKVTPGTITTDITKVIPGQNTMDIMKVRWTRSYQEKITGLIKHDKTRRISWRSYGKGHIVSGRGCVISGRSDGKGHIRKNMTDIRKVTSGPNTNDIRKGTWKRSDQRENTTGVTKVTYTNVTSGAGEGGKGDWCHKDYIRREEDWRHKGHIESHMRNNSDWYCEGPIRTKHNW